MDREVLGFMLSRCVATSDNPQADVELFEQLLNDIKETLLMQHDTIKGIIDNWVMIE